MTASYIWNANPKLWNVVSANKSGWDALREYLGDSSAYVYWSTPKLFSQIKVGDRAYIWRTKFSGTQNGVVAIGHVAESPRQLTPSTVPLFAHPDRLHAAGWNEGAAPSNWKTGIKIDELFWNAPIAAKVRPPQGSVGSLKPAEADAIDLIATL